MLWTRDFEYTMEFLYPLFDEVSRQAALDQTLYIMGTHGGVNCSEHHAHSTPVTDAACTNDEPMFQASNPHRIRTTLA